MRILGSQSGFGNLRDLLSYVIGIGGLVFILTRKDGTSNYPGITLFLTFIGAPYVLQRDQRRQGTTDDEPEQTKRAPAKTLPPAKRTPRKR